MYVTRLASNEIFSPSNEIPREVGQAKDLSASLYKAHTAATETFRRECSQRPSEIHSLNRTAQRKAMAVSYPEQQSNT